MGVPYAVHVNAGWRIPFTKLMCKRPPYGDIRGDRHRQRQDLVGPSARHRAPERSVQPADLLPFAIGTPNNGGAVTTASG